MSIPPPSTHVSSGAFLGSPVHTVSIDVIDAIIPDRIIGAKARARNTLVHVLLSRQII